MKYRIFLLPLDYRLKGVALRGTNFRSLTLEQAQSICSRDNKEASSRTAIARSGTEAYRYNRRFPGGWFLGYDLDK